MQYFRFWCQVRGLGLSQYHRQNLCDPSVLSFLSLYWRFSPFSAATVQTSAHKDQRVQKDAVWRLLPAGEKSRRGNSAYFPPSSEMIFTYSLKAWRSLSILNFSSLWICHFNDPQWGCKRWSRLTEECWEVKPTHSPFLFVLDYESQSSRLAKEVMDHLSRRRRSGLRRSRQVGHELMDVVIKQQL